MDPFCDPRTQAWWPVGTSAAPGAAEPPLLKTCRPPNHVDPPSTSPEKQSLVSYGSVLEQHLASRSGFFRLQHFSASKFLGLLEERPCSGPSLSLNPGNPRCWPSWSDLNLSFLESFSFLSSGSSSQEATVSSQPFIHRQMKISTTSAVIKHTQ